VEGCSNLLVANLEMVAIVISWHGNVSRVPSLCSGIRSYGAETFITRQGWPSPQVALLVPVLPQGWNLSLAFLQFRYVNFGNDRAFDT